MVGEQISGFLDFGVGHGDIGQAVRMRRRMRKLLYLLLCLPLWAAAQPAFPPVDEASTVPDFFSFRAQLQAAVARRDTAAVEAALDPAVRLSFGGESGLDGFRRMWK